MTGEICQGWCFLVFKIYDSEFEQTSTKKILLCLFSFQSKLRTHKSVLYSKKWVVNFRSFNDDMKSLAIHSSDSPSASRFAIFATAASSDEFNPVQRSSLKTLKANHSPTEAKSWHWMESSFETSPKKKLRWLVLKHELNCRKGNESPECETDGAVKEIKCNINLGQPAQSRTLFLPVTPRLYHCQGWRAVINSEGNHPEPLIKISRICEEGSAESFVFD